MRSVQVVNQDTDDITRADHMIGFDESGTITHDDVFTLSAVRCPRSSGERLAELLIECELRPWKAKSQQLVGHTSPATRNTRVEDLISRLDAEPIEWSTAVSYSSTSIQHKAAALCVLSQKTITCDNDYSGDAVIVPDGASDMYGHDQSILRQQAAQRFGGSFQSVFGEVYVSALPKADLTYPEVVAADYISGYIRSQVMDGVSITELPDTVVRFDENWREPEIHPEPFYMLRHASGDYGPTERRRVVAWLMGRHPEGDNFDSSSQYQNTVSNMVESQTVQEYLLEV